MRASWSSAIPQPTAPGTGSSSVLARTRPSSALTVIEVLIVTLTSHWMLAIALPSFLITTRARDAHAKSALNTGYKNAKPNVADSARSVSR